MDDLVPTWLDQLLATDPQQQEGALRKLIYHSTRETTIQRIKKSGKIKYITAALKSENEYVSMLAAWVTALVTFKDEETRHLFARANVIEGLVQLLENTDNPNVVQKACWAITNLSSDDEIREMMAQTPMMKLLTHLYRSTSSIDVKKAAIEPLINLLADKEQQRLFSRGGGISATISLFPYLEDEGEQKNATIMLYFMSIHFDELRAEIVRQGTLPVLQKQLLLKDNSIRELTMRLLNNLSVCEMNEMSILGSGVLFPVFDLLNSDDASEDLKKQSLMLLSNLATNEQVRASIRYCAWLEPVMNLLSNSRMDINEQALRFVINITFDEYCRKQLLDTGAVDLINGKKPQWSSGTEQINKLSLMAIENLLTPISDAVQAYLKTEVEIEFTPIEDDDDEVIDVQSDEDGKATIDPTSPRDKNLVIGAKHDEAKKPVHEEPSMDLDLVLEQLKVLSEHRKRVKENKEQAHKVQIQQQQQVTARREEEEKIKQKMTRENKLRTEGTLHARREVVAKDLLKTESDFLKTLEDVLKHYVLPLREAISTQRPVISEADVRSIFSITDMLYNINKSFLEKIKNRLKNWSYESIIGDIFTDLAAYFKAYQQYINNYSDAVATYSKCAKNNKEFQKFVKQAELKTDETDLFELLIQPINRVPKYLEYLHEFEKFTPSHHPDVRPVKKAIDSFELLVNFVNEIKPVAEKANKIIELENKFSNLEETLLTPTRLLIKDGTFIQEKKSGSRYIYLFLFNDVLVISMQRNKKQHKIRQIIHLTKIDNAMELSAPTLVANDELSYEVSTLNSSERPTIEDSTGLFRFAIIFEENGKKRAIAVAAPTVADRSAWVTAINTECRALKSKAAHDDHALGSTPKFNADNSDM